MDTAHHPRRQDRRSPGLKPPPPGNGMTQPLALPRERRKCNRTEPTFPPSRPATPVALHRNENLAIAPRRSSREFSNEGRKLTEANRRPMRWPLRLSHPLLRMATRPALSSLHTKQPEPDLAPPLAMRTTRNWRRFGIRQGVLRPVGLLMVITITGRGGGLPSRTAVHQMVEATATLPCSRRPTPALSTQNIAAPIAEPRAIDCPLPQ
mmetsp:Transcript_4770/g.11392  ORF Transcript_4770/g.11392 Transcript_4770/m.11392 type:complete len:208 (+) Transcript_4770:445-1068(+)